MHDPGETLTVTVTGAGTTAGTVEHDTTAATTTITDDAGAPAVSLVLTPSSVTENGGVSTVTATLSGASSEAVTVTVSASPVSPAVAGDFTQSGTTLTISAGQTTSTGSVTLTAVNNAVDAPDKSVTVSGSASGGNGVSAPSSQTLTITDDEASPTVSLVLSPSSVGENGGVSTVTAALSAASSEAVTVTVSSTPVSPAVAGDFSQNGTTLTIAAGATSSSGTVTLTAVNNAVDAPDKTVTVSGSASGGNGVSAPSSQTLTNHRRRERADGEPGADAVVDQRERRCQYGDGNAEHGVERDGDGDGFSVSSVPRSCRRLHAERRDSDDRGGPNDRHRHGDLDGGEQRGGRAGQDGDGLGFRHRRQRRVGPVVPDADDHGRRGRAGVEPGADAVFGDGERRREHGDGGH